MKWVTRDYVHLDRVACPWLIKRFIDTEASFVFVPWGDEDRRPADAIPFAIPDAELGPHDAQGTTFDKLLAKYRLSDPALRDIAQIIAKGVDYVLHGFRPERGDTFGQTAVGLLAISEGMMLVNDDDNAIIAASLIVYDALYANFAAHHRLDASGRPVPAPGNQGPTLKTQLLRELMKASPS
jgi:hypothetical protein